MSLQEKRLLIAMELSNKKWKLAMGNGSRIRERSLDARAEKAFVREVTVAKEKLGLPADAEVVCCYEAGRDGFWIDRMLKEHGMRNYILDPASIEVPRRARQRKTDRLDAKKLLKLLVRYELWGEEDSFSVVRVPDEKQEAQMRTHRERDRLKKERGMHRARIKSVCVLHGISISNPARVDINALRNWEGKPLGAEWVIELRREQQRLHLVETQLKELEQQQVAALVDPQTPTLKKARKLQQLKSVGMQTSWVLAHECLGWREFRNRKQLGSFAGLTGTPFDSGDTLHEQGISKAGSGRVRTTMVELAWLWVRYQPHSALTKWFVDKYVAGGSKRARRKGIVALARKLLIALWKYVEQDIVPEGAVLTA
jgi:transposase